MLSHTGGKVYLPPCLLRRRLRSLMYMVSFNPLSNHLGSVDSTSVFSNTMECWGWFGWFGCFETSEVVELYYRCSLNHAFIDLSGSPTYTTLHILILYTYPTTFSLPTGSFGFTNNCLTVFVGLKYVIILMPYFLNARLISSENPFTYGIMTGIFFDHFFTNVSIIFPDVSTFFLIHCYFPHNPLLVTITVWSQDQERWIYIVICSLLCLQNPSCIDIVYTKYRRPLVYGLLSQ